MRMSVAEAQELVDRAAGDKDGLYIKEDFINILTF